MTVMIFSSGLVRRSRVALSSAGFLITEKIVVVYSDLIGGYDAMKIVVRIYFALLQKPLTLIYTISTLNKCEQFSYPSCRNLLHVQMITDDLINCCCWNTQFVSYKRVRDLAITHSDPFYSFNVLISDDRRWTTCSR